VAEDSAASFGNKKNPTSSASYSQNNPAEDQVANNNDLL
jgi:hypothetical protein